MYYNIFCIFCGWETRLWLFILKGEVWLAILTGPAQRNILTSAPRSISLNEGARNERVSEVLRYTLLKNLNFAGQQQASLLFHRQLPLKYSLVYCRHKESTPPPLRCNSKMHVTRGCVPAESSCQQIFSLFTSSSLLCKLSAIFSQAITQGFWEIIAILPLPVIHLVSKYGHYEGTVARSLCGKLMADRKGQKRQDRWLCHHQQPDAMRELQCLCKCHSVLQTYSEADPIAPLAAVFPLFYRIFLRALTYRTHPRGECKRLVF